MFSCEYCRILKITCFEKHLRTAASVRCYFDKIILKQSGFWFFKKFLFQNENIEIISKIVNFNMKSRGFSKILKVKICFLNLFSIHTARILDLSLEIMLSPPKWGTKHLYNPYGFSVMLEQIYFHFLEAKLINVFKMC